MTAAASLDRGREAHDAGAWKRAYAALSEADGRASLDPSDLRLLATSAYMLGLLDEYVQLLERAHREFAESDRPCEAVSCAFWIGLELATSGQMGPAGGWFARANRMLDEVEGEPPERGYLLLPAVIGHAGKAEWDRAAEAAAEAVAIGERAQDRDLVALGRHEHGHALVRMGDPQAGLRLIDEAMVAATSGELSPVVTGILYCNVISYCRRLFELRRAREWTNALTRWCDDQPEMVAHTGQCLVHRAEILQLSGEWARALEEARRAGERFEADANERAAGHAFYRQGELQRVRGETGEAERSFREASRRGWEPQPGLALLRLAQGERGAAAAAITRALDETDQDFDRARLLPARVEIMLASGDLEAAREACDELDRIASTQPANETLAALANEGRGEVLLAEGDAGGALTRLRRAWRSWQELGAPYEAARARTRTAAACRGLGDAEAAELETEAARDIFEKLGARSDLSRLGAGAAPSAGTTHGLTAREIEVLRLTAAGRSNREIAGELVISEHTVARHLQNIYAKLGVGTRTAASAFAFEHDLV